MMFDWLPDFGMREQMLTIVKAIAAVGGAVIGWFVCDPLTRVTYRISFKGATPGAVLFLAKASGAAALGVTMWFMVSFGGGLGPGPGGGPGKGPGPGGDAVGKDPESITKDKKDPSHKTGSVESIDIEIIDAQRFKEDDRYFLVKGTEPALSYKELDDYLQKNRMKIEVTPVLTKGSVGVGRDDNPLSQLLALTKQYDIKTLRTKTP